VTRFTVRVDHDVCVGNAMCRALLPDVFVEDEHGQSVAVGVPATLDEALEAAADCPVGAIVVADADTGAPIESVV
jgi:ferredoxin